MSNRELDGRSKVVDYAKLGPVQVQTLLDSGQSGWTPHQEMLARQWLGELAATQEAANQAQQAEALRVARDTLDANRASLDVGRQSLKVSKDGLDVGRISMWIALVALVIAYLGWKALT